MKPRMINQLIQRPPMSELKHQMQEISIPSNKENAVRPPIPTPTCSLPVYRQAPIKLMKSWCWILFNSTQKEDGMEEKETRNSKTNDASCVSLSS